METALPRLAAWRVPVQHKFDPQALCIWALTGGLVLYLALDGGGYDVVVHSQAGIVVWWIALVAAVGGVLPATWPTLATRSGAVQRRPRRLATATVRVGTIVVAIACLIAIGVPLATTDAVQASQTAASAGDRTLALRDAREAARLQPGAASAQIQLALVEELQGDLRPALHDAQHAVRDEPTNWASWLILARLEAENGNPSASVAAFRQARALNPLFTHGSRTHHRRPHDARAR